MAPPTYEHILPHALAIPAFNKLAGKRIILASASPRRAEILKTFVRTSPIALAQRPERQHDYVESSGRRLCTMRA